MLKLANNIEDLYLKVDRDQKRSILNLIVSNFQLEDKLLRWKYKKPFDLMAFCAKNANWLTLVEELEESFKHPTEVDALTTCSLSAIESLLPPC